MRSCRLDEYCTLKIPPLPPGCTFTLFLSFCGEPLSAVFRALGETDLSVCLLRCPLVSSAHFLSISEIYGQFVAIITPPFQFLNRLFQFEAELSGSHRQRTRKWHRRGSHLGCLSSFVLFVLKMLW